MDEVGSTPKTGAGPSIENEGEGCAVVTWGELPRVSGLDDVRRLTTEDEMHSRPEGSRVFRAVSTLAKYIEIGRKCFVQRSVDCHERGGKPAVEQR